MKTIIQAIRNAALWIYALAYMAWAAPVTLAWDANPAGDAITHYELRHSTAADMIVHTAVKVTGTQHTLDLPPGEYHFEVVAVANGIASLPSNRVTHTIRPNAPKSFRIVIDAKITITPTP